MNSPAEVVEDVGTVLHMKARQINVISLQFDANCCSFLFLEDSAKLVHFIAITPNKIIGNTIILKLRFL